MMTKQNTQQIFFHLGMPKTGTTYLQKYIFPNLHGIKFFKKSSFNMHKTIDSDQDHATLLFSSEFDVGLEEKLIEISSLHQKPKVIYFLRQHSDWVKSKYKYYIRKHGYKNIKEFINIETGDSVFDINELNFQRKIALIEKHTNGQYIILDFKDLRNKPVDTINLICNFLGIEKIKEVQQKKVNTSFKPNQLVILKKFNGLYKYQESTASNKTVRRIHYKYREFLLHIIGFFSKIAPVSQKSKDKLIDADYIAMIDQKFSDDWKACLEKITRP